MKLLFSTHNNHKKEEIKKILPSKIELLSLSDLEINTEVEETGKTFEENAKIKSDFGYSQSQIPCFSDDSGLVVEALNGEPGIYSARYAESGNSLDNIKKVLKNLEGIKNRKAYFISVIAYTLNNTTHFFEGKIHGEILTEIHGENGFGYDPIFKPTGYDISFAEMDASEKNKISHRAIALKKFLEFI